MLAELKGRDGQIKLPGLYEMPRPLSDEDVFCANAVETANRDPMTHGNSRTRSCLFMPQPKS